MQISKVKKFILCVYILHILYERTIGLEFLLMAFITANKMLSTCVNVGYSSAG